MNLNTFILSGEWVISLMFSKSKNSKSSRMAEKLSIYVSHTLKTLGSIRVKLFLIVLTAVIIPIILTVLIINYYYFLDMINSQVANMQTSTAMMAGEFSQYETLSEAQKNGMYQQMQRYSALNTMRIRVVNDNFLITSDSYSIENGKNAINSRVLRAYATGKSISDYDSKTGTLEAVSPIYNSDKVIMGVLVVDMDISAISSFVAEVRQSQSTVIVAMLVLVTAVLLFLSMKLGKNIKNAYNVVRDVANGHIDKRIEIKGSVEVRSFAKNFNTIMDKASALDENRQEFVSNVSHELKTPITSIKVLADSLNMQENVPVELYKEFMQDITKEIDRESKIIDDLLSMVKMDKGSSAINISSVNLNELLEIVLKRLKPIAQKKNVELLFESFRPVVAEVDEVKFTQVISNLVENAIKYNRLDGWVHVSLNADYQYFYVRVEDSGIGIKKECQDKVFERFYRVDKARSRETGGTGLGLAIVQKIVLMHHGTIKLHSEEGVGTTFTVRIPLNYVG